VNIETQQIELGNIIADVELKDIKNIHLSVYPPVGKVRISAPAHFDLETIRMFAISKLSWIKQQQEKIRNQQREAPRAYVSRETHFVFGKRYLLKVVKTEGKQQVTIKYDKLILLAHPNATVDQKHVIIQEWYRDQLKKLVPKYIAKWEEIMNVQVSEFGIKKMKTKWGTCNREAQRIWINLELAKKPQECLEYIVIHEMVHLIERTHNNNFVAHMDKFLPHWRHLKEELNRLPVSHSEWKY
jgi:predicted metal-dependent hydrolase